jgi:hypothetical protein
MKSRWTPDLGFKRVVARSALTMNHCDLTDPAKRKCGPRCADPKPHHAYHQPA